MICLRPSTIAVLCVLTVPSGAQAQTAAEQGTAPQVFALDEALQYAVEHYPTVKAALEQVNASTAGVSVARSGYLPRLDSLWQANRATANNIFGQVLPQSVIPAMTGPVLSSASGQSIWGTATGALFSWEPMDFGLRAATVRGAEAAVVRARADEALTRLDVQGAVGAAFLAVVVAEQAVVAAEADVKRAGRTRPRGAHVG
jgi:outer membrane protein